MSLPDFTSSPKVPHNYDFAVADTANGKVAANALHKEIRDSDMDHGADLAGVLEFDDAGTLKLRCEFPHELTSEDETKLAAVVAAHPGVPLPVAASLVKLDSPAEDDGKPVVVMSPAPEGLLTFFCGRGDDASPTAPATGRGTGDPIAVECPQTLPDSGTYPAALSAEWSYNEPVWLHDGQLNWDPGEFTWKDHFSLSVKIPATTVTPNGGGTGNCNLVEVAPGSGALNMYVIVPAAGNGTHDVDLANAVPVPYNRTPDGFWDCDEYTDEVTISATPGAAKWHLMTFEIRSYFIRCVPMANTIGVYDVDVYKTDWVSSKWTFVLDCHKETAPSADTALAGWLMTYREFAQ